MIVELAALVAIAVIVGAQLERALTRYREHRAARRRAEQLLDRHLARHDGEPPSHVRRTERSPNDFGFGPWHG